MKNSNVFEKFTPTRIGALSLISLFGAGTASAQFSTGFETTSGYTSNATVIGVQDSAAPSGNVWTLYNGSATASTANPADGDLALTVTGTGSAAQGAVLNLGTAAPTSGQFTVQFDFAVSADISASSGLQSQVYFGGQNGPGQMSNTTIPYWFGFYYDNGALALNTHNDASAYVSRVNIGTYTDFSDLGEYITVSISIDPSTEKYTSVTLSGETSNADVTSIVLASNFGNIPTQNIKVGLPENYFSVVMGSNDTGSTYIYNLSVIPEPSAAALFLGLSASVMLFVRRRRA
jgi:hypothetical protein